MYNHFLGRYCAMVSFNEEDDYYDDDEYDDDDFYDDDNDDDSGIDYDDNDEEEYLSGLFSPIYRL